MLRTPLSMLALLVATSTPVFAADSVPPTAALSASASVKVPADEMLVTFFVERDGVNLGAVNQQVLRELQGALTEAKSIKGINAKLGSVWTSQTWGAQGKPTGWKVRGEVVLDSRQLKELGDLSGQLSQRLGLGAVSFRLSGPKRDELNEKLIAEAASTFRAKAQVTATALGFQTYELKDVNVNENTTPGAPLPMAKVMRMAANTENSGMPTDGGNTEVSVTMTGTVVLH